ncbi:MAG: hypothetical protein Q9218_002019 [Villophora microphyllina]
MTKHTFHLTPHASSPLYNLISSQRFRLSILILTVLDIILFSIGVGLGAKWVVEDPGYLDLAIGTHFCEKLALGMMFLPFTWLLFLLVWDLLNKPKLHPGYYIGFDCYVAVSTITSLTVLMVFSAVVAAGDGGSAACGENSYRLSSEERTCMKHLKPLKNLDILAYALAIWIGILHFCLFAIACRVCTVYGREKNANKQLQQKGVRLQSPKGSSSEERIVVPSRDESNSRGGSAVQEVSSV